MLSRLPFPGIGARWNPDPGPRRGDRHESAEEKPTGRGRKIVYHAIEIAGRGFAEKALIPR
jgi:hypothetical protein